MPGRRLRQPAVTRQEILVAARHVFASRGYDQTKMEDVVAETTVTRGALYHHFDSKEQLFWTVLQNEIESNVASLPPEDPREDFWEGVIWRLGCYLDLCLRPQTAQIVLVDGPKVFGLQAVAALGENAQGSLFEEVLRRAMRAGLIERLPVGALAHVIASAVIEGGIYVSAASDPRRARRDLGKVLDRLLLNLRPRE
jgi:AcrR family transcriptional regulator